MTLKWVTIVTKTWPRANTEGTGSLSAREVGTIPDKVKADGHPRTAGSLWRGYWKRIQMRGARWGLSPNNTVQRRGERILLIDRGWVIFQGLSRNNQGLRREEGEAHEIIQHRESVFP